MAMEKSYVVADTHTRSITAIGYNPSRREILLGCEDGVVKTWEAESGKLVMVSHEHKGWVTDFLYWNDAKLMLSSANDGDIIAWSSGGGVADRINCTEIILNQDVPTRPDNLSFYFTSALMFYKQSSDKESGQVIDNRVLFVATEHTDIVRCIVCHES